MNKSCTNEIKDYIGRVLQTLHASVVSVDTVIKKIKKAIIKFNEN